MNQNTAQCLEEFVSSVRMLATKISTEVELTYDLEQATDAVIVTANTLIGVLQRDETIITNH